METILLILRYRTSDALSMFILLSTMDWYLEVRIWAEDKQYSSCQLIQETKVTEILNISISLYHVERDTCTVHGRGTKTRYSGLMLILQFGKDWHSIRHDRMQLFFEARFQLIAFKKLKDWKLEKSCTRNDTCLLGHHQRSHWNTITIGPKGMIIWVLQLNNSQLGNSFNSLLEKHLVLSFPSQSNPNPIQSVIDQGNLRTQNVFLWREEKRPVHKRSMINVCTKNLVLQMEQGNLWNCLKTFASCMFTMEQGNLWNRAQAHTQWKNLFLPNIVTLHHPTRTTSSTVQATRRTSTSTSQECRIRRWNDRIVSTFKIWFRRSRTTLSDKHFRVIFKNIEHSTFSAKHRRTRSKPLENTELCEIVGADPKAQCRACLAYWDVGIVCCTCGHFLRDDTAENKKYFKSVLDLFSIPNFYIRKGRPHGHRYGKKEGDQEYHTANQLQKKCKKRRFLNIHDRFIRDAWFRKSMLEMGRNEEAIREMDRLANEDQSHS